MKALTFNCSRTCPHVSRAQCKFSPIFSPIGPSVVNSHTTSVQIEFRSRDALQAAVEKLGGSVIGEGKHHLFSSSHTGFGFQLPGWEYPIIAGRDCALHYDTYQGQWGNEADIRKLTGQYAIEAARQAAMSQGWVAQDNPDGLLIYHPTGGSIQVKTDGTVESSGFTGQGCDAATVIEQALGSESVRSNKSEYFAERAVIQTKE